MIKSPGVGELCFLCVCSTRALGHVKQTLIDALRQVHQRSSFFEIVLVGSVSQLSGVFTDSAGSIALARRDGRLSKTNRRRKRSDSQTKNKPEKEKYCEEQEVAVKMKSLNSRVSRITKGWNRFVYRRVIWVCESKKRLILFSTNPIWELHGSSL